MNVLGSWEGGLFVHDYINNIHMSSKTSCGIGCGLALHLPIILHIHMVFTIGEVGSLEQSSHIRFIHLIPIGLLELTYNYPQNP